MHEGMVSQIFFPIPLPFKQCSICLIVLGITQLNLINVKKQIPRLSCDATMQKYMISIAILFHTVYIYYKQVWPFPMRLLCKKCFECESLTKTCHLVLEVNRKQLLTEKVPLLSGTHTSQSTTISYWRSKGAVSANLTSNTTYF